MKAYLPLKTLIYSPLFILCGGVNAADSPAFSGEGVIEMQSEQDKDRHQLFLRTEVAPTLRLSEEIHIDGVFVLEPIHDAAPGQDAFFKDEGIFAEEIKINFTHGPWSAFAGKFNPGFGIAWDYGRGIWSEDFAEDYEITEKIGFGGGYALQTYALGTHQLNLSTFFADTSVLSQSLVTKRGRTHTEDGGASNTEDFSSFVAAVESDDAGGIENVRYKLGYRHLGSDDDDETGWVLMLGHVHRLTETVAFDMLLEYADIRDFEGVSGEDRRYISASIVTTFDERWNLTLGYTARHIDGSRDDHDHLVQVSGGYDFQNGLTLEAGWKNTEEAQDDHNIFGILGRYAYAF